MVKTRRFVAGNCSGNSLLPVRDRCLNLLYPDGLLAMHFRGGEFQRVLQQGQALYAQCLEQWPGDGGPTGLHVAKVVADAAARLGDAAAEALWRARAAASPRK